MAPDNTVKASESEIYAQEVVAVWNILRFADKDPVGNAKHLWSLALSIVIQTRM